MTPMPPPIRVIKAGYGYQICQAIDPLTGKACNGYGCSKCHGMGETPAVTKTTERRPQTKTQPQPVGTSRRLVRTPKRKP